jgi:hypothetical protein
MPHTYKRHNLNTKRIAAILLGIIIPLIIIPVIPVSADTYTELFKENFQTDTLSSAWQVLGTGAATITDTSIGRALECKGNIHCQTGDNTAWTNYQVKMDFVLTQGEAFVDFRFYTYINDQGKKVNGYYRWKLTEGKMGLFKTNAADGWETEEQELKTVAAPLSLNTKYTIAGQVIGNTIYVGLNDSNGNSISSISYADKTPFYQGATAIGTISGTAYFNNYIVLKVESAAPITTSQITTTPKITSSAAPGTTTITMTLPGTSNQPPSTITTVIAIPATTQTPTPFFSLRPINLATIIGLISLIIAISSFAGVLISRRVQNRQKRHLKQLLDEVDTVYTHFKMNARRCEAELYRLKDMVTTDLKEGKLEEGSYGILDKRLDSYMQEIQERILDESLGSFPTKLRDTLHRLIENGEVDEHQFAAIEKMILTSDELTDADRARLKESLERWRESYLKKGKQS